MDVKTTFRNLVRDQSVSICMLHYTYSMYIPDEVDKNLARVKSKTYVEDNIKLRWTRIYVYLHC